MVLLTVRKRMVDYRKRVDERASAHGLI